MLDDLDAWGVDTRFISKSAQEGTGTFIAEIDQTSGNTMVGTLGANATISGEEVSQTLGQIEAPVLLLQLETSKESAMAALKTGRG
ncbi:putative PfkB domain-containing protein [Bifidobacterium actinocoloniiforme DSM 22766]|uniref:Putative PfkB domain-containing protein n=1 Tax=Bifidobacterium actinocoloniiforme DSM 22766 TaxID=1437605 RepID=A0A086YYI3_9BIFI|nr:hypothetical protein [Bifidobacterium actinocoloniiforme]KFI39333.1 putative PfkB domain-containing protein [Bifidobacterium actinocoloniiforme DSM 22766]